MEKSLHGAIIAVSHAVIEAEPILTELDSALGDGACGMGLKTGFADVIKALEGGESDTPQELLKKVAKTLIASIGGTSGAIYGTAFMRMAAMAGKVDLNDPKSVCDILTAGLEGAKTRGEDTKVGDKTMIDAYEPAVNVFNAVIQRGGSFAEGCTAAVDAAQKGSDSTIDLIARKGRASYLGERSIGHRDAGSYGIVVICKALQRYLAA